MTWTWSMSLVNLVKTGQRSIGGEIEGEEVHLGPQVLYRVYTIIIRGTEMGSPEGTVWSILIRKDLDGGVMSSSR